LQLDWMGSGTGRTSQVFKDDDGDIAPGGWAEDRGVPKVVVERGSGKLCMQVGSSEGQYKSCCNYRKDLAHIE